MEKEINYIDACRMIAERIVGDVKLYPQTSIRVIVNAYWDSGIYIMAHQARWILELYRATDMGVLPSLHAKFALSESIYRVNTWNTNIPDEISKGLERENKVKEFALELAETADFFKQLEESE